MRYVVMKDVCLARPCYVARDEADASRFLDTIEAAKLLKGLTVERQNSLTLRVTGNSVYDRWETIATPSFDDEPSVSAVISDLEAAS